MTYNGPTIFKDAGGEGALPGDNVRMVLDTNALELGPELIALDNSQSGEGVTVDAAAGTVSRSGATTSSTVEIGVTPASVGLKNGDRIFLSFDVEDYANSSGVAGIGWSSTSAVGGSTFTDRMEVKNGRHVAYLSITDASKAMNFAFVDGTNGTAKNISVREITGIHADQPSTALQPVLGRAPASRRNLLANSEDLSATAWGKLNTSVTPNTHADEAGIQTLDSVIENTADNQHTVSFPATSFEAGAAYSASLTAKAAGRDIVAIVFPFAAYGAWLFASFRLTGAGEIVAKDAAVSAKITALGGGLYRCEATATATTTATNTAAAKLQKVGTNQSETYLGDGVSGIALGRAQVEKGPAATSYQSVKANGLDVTEPGKPSYSYLRFDAVDDKLPQAYPEAKTGDLLICGRNGSWIDRGVSVPAGGSLSVISGKDSPKTPGIAPALGDIVGSLHAPRTLNDYEIAKLTEYWQERGAKGLLVPSGVELWTDADVVADANWTKNGDGTYTADGTSDGFLSIPGVLRAGDWVKSSIEVVSRTEGSVYRPYDGRGENVDPLSAAGVYSRVWKVAPGINPIPLYVYAKNVFTGTIGNISVQKLVIQ